MVTQNKSEYVCNGKIHKNWLLPLWLSIVVFIAVGFCGYLLVQSTVINYWATQYLITKEFSNNYEAQTYQSEILNTAKSLNAKTDVEMFVSKDDKYVVSGFVTSSTPFPYGDNSYPMNEYAVKIPFAIIFGLLGVIVWLRFIGLGETKNG